MPRLLLLFGGLIFLRILINGVRYFRCKHYLKGYYKWIENRDWEYVQCHHAVLKLFKDAGVKEGYVANVQPAGFGLVQTGTVSVFLNFPSARQDMAAVIITAFNQAIGVYRQRVFESINPLFWIEFVVNLPRFFMVYLGLPPESLVVKVLQILYWIASIALGIVWTLFKPNVEIYLRSWLNF